MSLETQAERFIETLKGLGGSAGNGSLNNELGWAESTYQRVKAHLIEANLHAIALGKQEATQAAHAKSGTSSRPRKAG